MANEDLSRLHIDRDAVRSVARRRLRWWWLAAVLLAAGAAYWAFAYNAPVSVELTTVSQAYPSQAHTLLNATGYVVAQRKAAVASKATGRLEWLNVREGSQVKAGEILARLESNDVRAQMQQAAAGVRVAQANLEQGNAELKDAARALARSRDLLAQKFVSPAAHDIVVARHEKAQAALSGFKASIAVAQANLRVTEVAVEQTLIRAPFDGVVLTKNANVGDVITPFSSALGSQAAVVTMADMTTLEVEADVSEANLAKVKLGQPCEIQLDALPGQRFRGTVQRTVPTVDRAKATVLVKVRFVDADPRILPEMSAKVAFLENEMPSGERAARTVVQPAAIVERGGASVMFVVRDGKAAQVAVMSGMKIGELVEVTGGVAVGDKVVVRPPEKLHDGSAVAVSAK
ncbi:MAG: efflux RND transporter periplasmic adaptor subunit [Burkholderiales bacterium]|nr:efflux RND transporter periplasmic adaptor subunit [Burkholderiales bacterium]